MTFYGFDGVGRVDTVAIRLELEATHDEVPMSLSMSAQYPEVRLHVGNSTRRLTAEELLALASAARLLAMQLSKKEEI
jgi:hypothetical protein